ncbi:hypothetical protein FRX31_004959 [Thalictrum thalictroides]|uniref:RING-type E3 ubiquitin transferase n=1 Tax=Thalictrum thalictroides TaxID=46969 RepID=A0A7J6XAH8_THATH|nr:hypothetical protein FRX31_004959 [Thalictrum thalictroides]
MSSSSDDSDYLFVLIGAASSWLVFTLIHYYLKVRQQDRNTQQQRIIQVSSPTIQLQPVNNDIDLEAGLGQTSGTGNGGDNSQLIAQLLKQTQQRAARSKSTSSSVLQNTLQREAASHVDLEIGQHGMVVQVLQNTQQREAASRIDAEDGLGQSRALRNQFVAQLLQGTQQRAARSSYKSSLDDGLSNMNECVICLEELNTEDKQSLSLLGCNHMFHIQCISQWMVTQLRCPICRAFITY